jgi:hypothetical protein
MRSTCSSHWSRIARVLTTAGAVIFLTEGCGAAIMSSSWGARPDKLSPASTRAEVTSELGRPVASQATPDGGRVDTYDYRAYKAAERPSFKDAAEYVMVTLRTIGLSELFLTPYALYRVAKHPRSEMQIAIGPDDRVVWIGSPPPYGPPDTAVPLSIGAIRESCRSQDGGEPSERSIGGGGENLRPSGDRYVRCVARRFAIWGIE